MRIISEEQLFDMIAKVRVSVSLSVASLVAIDQSYTHALSRTHSFTLVDQARQAGAQEGGGGGQQAFFRRACLQARGAPAGPCVYV